MKIRRQLLSYAPDFRYRRNLQLLLGILNEPQSLTSVANIKCFATHETLSYDYSLDVRGAAMLTCRFTFGVGADVTQDAKADWALGRHFRLVPFGRRRHSR